MALMLPCSRESGSLSPVGSAGSGCVLDAPPAGGRPCHPSLLSVSIMEGHWILSHAVPWSAGVIVGSVLYSTSACVPLIDSHTLDQPRRDLGINPTWVLVPPPDPVTRDLPSRAFPEALRGCGGRQLLVKADAPVTHCHHSGC